MSEAGGTERRPPLLRAQKNGWRIQWKNDGTDYPALLASFRAGVLPANRLNTGSPDREVFRLEHEGRLLVIKHDREQLRALEKKLWVLFGGTAGDRLLKLTNRAVTRGCRLVQDVYLVAEKMSGPFCREAYLIAEYVEGLSFLDQKDRPGQPVAEWTGAIARTLAALHRQGLASNDAHAGNFIINPRGDHGLVMIDLNPDGPLVVCQANDLIKWKRSSRYPTEVPIEGAGLKIVFRVLYGWWALRRRLRRWRNKGGENRPSNA